MKTVCLAIVVATLTGCSSITSKRGLTGTEGDGLVYYLPKKNFLVSVTRADGKLTAITLGTTPAYADLSTAYALRYNKHLLAKNKVDIEVSSAGLLTSSKANTTGDVAEAFKGLGTLAGSFRARSGPSVAVKSVQEKDMPCDVDGTHTFVYRDPVKDEKVCNGRITVSIERLWEPDNVAKVTTRLANGEKDSGIFYRMNRPYLMEARGAGLSAANIVASPSESEPLFLPVARTFFTANDAQITLQDGGVPSKYVQETDGEFIALFKIPANILTAYFDAIAAMFGKSSANDAAQTKALTDSLKLELIKQKYESCLAAINAKNETLIKDLKCSDG